jgi:hypothetical protein
MHMNSPRTLPRIRRRIAAISAVAMTCFTATSIHATDLRGRVDIKSTHGVTVELRSPKPPHAAIRTVVCDRDGRYYIADIPPGRYELVVNGITVAIAVEQVAIQELPPIPLKS